MTGSKVSFSDRLKVKVELLPLQVRSSQLRWYQTSHWGGVTGMSNREETLWQTYDTLERLNLSSDLRMPWDTSPEELVEVVGERNAWASVN